MTNTAHINRPPLTWVDNIKLLATLAVIGIHVSAYGVGLEYAPGHGNFNWWVSNFYESWFRCSVPLFVMITGSLLLPQDITLNTFLRKRFNRILLPFLFWSAIYIAYNLAIRFRTQPNPSNNLGGWLWIQISQGAQYHLWYVYMLIGLYLFIPILQPWIKTASNKTILYFLGIWIIVLLLNQLSILKNSALDLRYFSGYIGYLILGYYISDRMIIGAKVYKTAILLLVIGFAITFWGTYLVTKAQGSFSSTFYDFLTVNVCLLSIGAFIVIKGSSGKGSDNAIGNLRNVISKYGYGIYLCHPFLLNFMVHFKLDYKLLNPVIGIPLTSIICMALSFVLVYLIGKLPYGKHISG